MMSIFGEGDNAPLRGLVPCGTLVVGVASGCCLTVFLGGDGNELAASQDVANSPTSRTYNPFPFVHERLVMGANSDVCYCRDIQRNLDTYYGVPFS